MKEKKQAKLKKENKQPKLKRATIGGQAVMEGVMMRGVSSMATAVRGCDGEITLESQRFAPTSKKSVWYKIPVIRGVLNFFSMMYLGVNTVIRSAEALGEEFEPSKFEQWFAKKSKLDLMKVAMVFAVILGVAFAVGLFVVLPELVVGAIFKITWVAENVNVVLRNLGTGLLRILIFVLYIVTCTRMKEIKRLFMYHGAEHKTINAFEHGEELTVSNVQKYTTVHKRCGTTFMFLVMVVSILVFSVLSFLPRYNEVIFKILYKILFLPLVAGISYEILKLLALSDNLAVRIIRAPGLWLQKLTTKQPDDDMVEVAIAAFKEVEQMDADPTLPEQKFVIKTPMKLAEAKLKKLLPEEKFEQADIDWILCEVLDCGRCALVGVTSLNQTELDRAMELAKDRATGKPLQYVLGYTDFYGVKIKTDGRALIPRPETELLAEQVIKLANGKMVLDLCTGSGAIAVAVKKNANATVFASDISADALALAEENAAAAGAEINFVQSDMFENIEGKFDIIVSNPPYIPTADIDGLQTEVKDFEPRLALDGDADGLKFYRTIAKFARQYLNDGGVVAMEFGIGQKAALEEIFEGFESNFILDYQNIPRILIAK